VLAAGVVVMVVIVAAGVVATVVASAVEVIWDNAVPVEMVGMVTAVVAAGVVDAGNPVGWSAKGLHDLLHYSRNVLSSEVGVISLGSRVACWQRICHLAWGARVLRR